MIRFSHINYIIYASLVVSGQGIVFLINNLGYDVTSGITGLGIGGLTILSFFLINPLIIIYSPVSAALLYLIVFPATNPGFDFPIRTKTDREEPKENLNQ
jgi:hypothetical protein